MYSIGEVVKKTKLTARALRHYEKKGLITSVRPSRNGSRYYDSSILSTIELIKSYKAMNFTLEEVRSILELQETEFDSRLEIQLKQKLDDVTKEIDRLQLSKADIEAQLLATKKFVTGNKLAKHQRGAFMEAIQKEIIENLKLRRSVDHGDLDYLNREHYFYDTDEKRDFFNAIKSCLEFAKEEGIRLGPVRGAAPASLFLYAIGFSNFDPRKENLIPERILSTNMDLHIDVEFENGKRFVDYCKSISSELKVGKIDAFKLPILDIIENTHKALGKRPNYEAIDDNDPLILNLFRQGDIEHIFSIDIPKETLLAKHFDAHYYRNGLATPMLQEYLKSQEVLSFKDVLNIEAIFRPNMLEEVDFMQEHINRYPLAKTKGFKYDCLSPSLNEYLRPNFGVIIYQEDIIHILREYTGWSYEKCAKFRRSLSLKTLTTAEKTELAELVPPSVLELLYKEAPVTFCKAHSLGAWPQLIKQTAVLKALHNETYLGEIKKWEDKHNYSWGDFGFISGGVSLLQQ